MLCIVCFVCTQINFMCLLCFAVPCFYVSFSLLFACMVLLCLCLFVSFLRDGKLWFLGWHNAMGEGIKGRLYANILENISLCLCFVLFLVCYFTFVMFMFRDAYVCYIYVRYVMFCYVYDLLCYVLWCLCFVMFMLCYVMFCSAHSLCFAMCMFDVFMFCYVYVLLCFCFPMLMFCYVMFVVFLFCYGFFWRWGKE